MASGASRIYHVNSNCSDLDRSLAFYRDLVGMHATTRTVPSREQPGAAFGLDAVAWDAWILQGDVGGDGLSLDLLEWKTPRPGAAPPASYELPGFNRLCFTSPDVAATVERMRAAGVRVVGGPVEMDLGNGSTMTMAMVLDPDGVPVQLVGGRDVRVSHVIVNCRSLDASLAYYTGVMGLTVQRESRHVRQGGELYGWTRETEVSSALLRDPGSKFFVELVEWHEPVAAPSANGLRRANDLGLFRMAWATDDCARDEATVRAAGSVPFAPTSELSVGDDLPLLQVLFWPGPDGECLELIQAPTAPAR